MSKTRTDLILTALNKLSVLGGGQDAPAEDVQAVDKYVDALIADLSDRNVIYVADANDIDDGVFPHLAMLLAQMSAEDFEKQVDAGKIEFAESRLRTISRIGKGTGGNLKVDPAIRPRRTLGTYRF